ncbi:hypothetical protein ACQKWADRAFT_311428 [Trichoderma austrokoningii]
MLRRNYNNNVTISHKSERKARQKEQKLQLQAHQPQQRVNRRHREPRDQPERQNRRDSQPTPAPKTPETFDRGTQTDVVIQPMLVRKEPRREHNTPAAIIPPQAPLRRRIFMVLFGAAFFVGLTIGQVFRWLAPKAAEPIYLAIEVFVVSMVNFIIILAIFLLRLVSGNWGQLDYDAMMFMTVEVLFLMLTTVLISGYITRQVQGNDAAFSSPAQVGPYKDGDTSEDSDEGGYIMWNSSSEDEFDFARAD